MAERRVGRAAFWKALRLRPAGGDRLVVGVELAAGTASLRPTWKERRDVVGQLTKKKEALYASNLKAEDQREERTHRRRCPSRVVRASAVAGRSVDRSRSPCRLRRPASPESCLALLTVADLSGAGRPEVGHRACQCRPRRPGRPSRAPNPSRSPTSSQRGRGRAPLAGAG